MKILVTGGTTFVSESMAIYFEQKGHEVYVLNRGTKKQPSNVTLLKHDRHSDFDISHIAFDVVIDVTAYTGLDVRKLLNALNLDDLKSYILISSSAVYHELDAQPFLETLQPKENKIWGKYGLDKIEAEKTLMEGFEHYYIIRPPYLYGPKNNVYREAFVFDCAMQKRPFYLPQDGSLPLHFFYIDDLCKLVEKMIDTNPEKRIYNVGNENTITIKEWVHMCYQIVGQEPLFINVDQSIPQRSYFPFYDYAYKLDVTRQKSLLKTLTPIKEGLKKSYAWYINNQDKVTRKPFLEFISKELEK